MKKKGYTAYEDTKQLAKLLVLEDAPFAIVISSTFAHCRELFAALRRELHEFEDCNHAKLLVSQQHLEFKYGSNVMIFRSVATNQDSLRGKHASHVIDATFPQTVQQMDERLKALHLILLPMLRA